MDSFNVGIGVSHLFFNKERSNRPPIGRRVDNYFFLLGQMLFLSNYLHSRTMCNIDHYYILYSTTLGLNVQTLYPFLLYVMFFIVDEL